MKDASYRLAMQCYTAATIGLLLLFLEVWFTLTHLWYQDMPLQKMLIPGVVVFFTIVFIMRKGNRADYLYWKWKRGY